jgi:hypothetical protein
VLFCSTGNDGIYGMNTPANYARTYDNVIAVGSFNHVDDTRASSSNYHPRMSGVAPGVSVPALAPDGTETTVNGTSFATPHALQLCAMGMTGGSFTAMQVADALRRNLRATAEPAEDGGGAFDFDAALAALLDTTPSTDTAVTARAWTVEVGPAQVGQTIGTAQALTWTPSTQGDYTLRYTATHPGGLASDDVDVHVEPAAVVPVTPDPAGITLVGADAGTTATSTPAAALVTVLGLDGAAGLSAPAVAAALVADGQAAAAVVNLSPDAAVYTVAAGAADVLTVAVANADAGAATVAVAGGDPAPVVTGFAAPAEGGPAALDVSGAVASTPVEASATLGGVGAAAAPGVSASPAALTAAGFEPERALGSTAQTAAAVVLALDAAAVTSVAAPASTADLAVLGAQATSLAGQFATPDAAAAGLDGQAAAARVGASPGSGDFDAPAQPPATVPTVNAESAGLTVTAVSAAVEAQNTAQSEATSAAIEVLAGAATGEQTIVGLAVVAEHTITAVDPGSARVVGAAPTTAANTLEANGPGVMAATGVVFATVGAAGQPVAAALAATPAAATPAAAGHDPNVNTSGLSDATPDPAAVAVGSGDPSARAAAGADLGPVGFAALDGGPEVGANPSAGMVWVSGAQFTDVTDAAPSVGPAAPLTETTIAGHGATPNTKGGSAPSPDPAAAGLSAAAPAAGVGAATGAAVPTFTAQPTTSTVAPTVAAATTSVPGHNPPMAVTTRADAAAPDVEADGPGLGITGQREVTPSTADTVGFTAHTPAPSVSSRGLPGAAPLDGDGLDVTGTATTGPDAAAVGVAGQPTPTGVTPPASPPGGVTVTAPQASSTAEAVARPVPEAAGWTVAPPVLGFAVVAHIEAAVAGVSAADALGAVFRFIDAGAAAAALDGSAPGVRMGPGAVAALVVAAALDALAQVPILRGTVVEETPPRPSVEETSRAHGPEGAILQIIEWSRAHASAAEWERR